MQTGQYMVLTNNQTGRPKRGLVKLMLAGTVALTAAVVASLCLYQGLKPKEGIVFYGDAVHQEKQVAFMQFLAKYGKTYATKSDLNSRFATFSENYDAINAHNAANVDRFKMGINRFSDLTVEEFTQLYGTTGVQVKAQQQVEHARPLLSQAPLLEEQDWHKAGKMTTPSDQGGCGSCWAFTTAATMEAAFAIRHGSQPDKLSVQYLIDCDPVNFGCGGGWMLDAYTFTKQHGLVKEGDYPNRYLGRKESCKDSTDKPRIKNDDMKEEDNISIRRLKEIVSQQPVGVAMHSNPKCLMGYHSGVIRESDCKCSFEATATVNHAVTIVGYGKNTQNNQDECPEYWKIRNSWGANWGEEGYFKLCIPKVEKSLPTGTCQVQSYVQYPLFSN